MQTTLKAHGLSMEKNTSAIFISLVASFVTGFSLVFFYAASRARLGPGPRTAIIVAVASWIGGYVISLLDLHMLGLFAFKMLARRAIVGLVEMVLAALFGAWLYRED